MGSGPKGPTLQYLTYTIRYIELGNSCEFMIWYLKFLLTSVRILDLWTSILHLLHYNSISRHSFTQTYICYLPSLIPETPVHILMWEPLPQPMCKPRYSVLRTETALLDIIAWARAHGPLLHERLFIGYIGIFIFIKPFLCVHRRQTNEWWTGWWGIVYPAICESTSPETGYIESS